ncbi:MAG: LptF/LptG family permease [Chlamydiales bacterium]|nr:LptF/LptG family permease [Chlamydiales bacterium]
MTILHRHYLFQLLRMFALVLSTLFGLYILIDYTSRASGLHLSIYDLALYYVYMFISRLDILMPFALLIAGINTLCQSNLRQEIMAMRAAGVTFMKLLTPLVWVGTAATFAIYLSTQFLVPASMQWISKMEDTYSIQNSHGSRQIVHKMVLADGSRLLYLYYDRARNQFVKNYWIRSLDDVYRINYLDPDTTPPTGYAVERLARDDTGALVPVATYADLPLDMKLNPDEVTETITMPSERSLTQLWSRLPHSSDNISYEQAQTEAAFYKKLAMPWLCLIALLAPAPFCVAHRRPLRVFYVFAGSLFGLFTLFIILSVGYTLTQSQLMSPIIAIIAPIMAATAVASWNYLTLR